MKRLFVCSTLFTATALSLLACGGSDSPPTETTIEGAAVKGPVSNATVTAKKADGEGVQNIV